MLFKQNKKYPKKEIVQIIFRQSTSRIGGENYLIVDTKNAAECFVLIYSTKTIKGLIDKLKGLKIKTQLEFKIE